MNNKFAEMTFPVVLSTQLTSIYDKEIQELLGFYSLCTYVLDKFSSRLVYLGVCPVQFALYLKLRMARLHLLSEYLRDYNEHIAACHCDMNIKITTWLISRAFKLHPVTLRCTSFCSLGVKLTPTFNMMLFTKYAKNFTNSNFYCLAFDQIVIAYKHIKIYKLKNECTAFHGFICLQYIYFVGTQ